MKIPVALFIYNRLEVTSRVFEMIKAYKPDQLFIIADGSKASDPNDQVKISATRNIFNDINWKCDIRQNYSETNLGCHKRISSGIDWVFNHCDKAVFLEDDCLPHPDFFTFCEELLSRYQDDLRIMHISGSNYLLNKKKIQYSYYYSLYNHCSGWATWSRAWTYFDSDVAIWPILKMNRFLHGLFSDKRSRVSWEKIFQSVYDKEIDSWAYCWTLSCWFNNGLSIIPNRNLVSNIGYGHGATHTKNPKSRFANMPVHELTFPLQHPPDVVRDIDADAITQKLNYDKTILRRIGSEILKSDIANIILKYIK